MTRKVIITQATVAGTFTHEVEIKTDSVGEFHLGDIPDVTGDLRGTQMVVIIIADDQQS